MSIKSERVDIPWPLLVGGQTESSWDDYLIRKFQKTKIFAHERKELAMKLAVLKACRICSVEVLRQLPQACSWYIALACLARNHIRNVSMPPDLSTKLDTFIKNMRTRPGTVSDSDKLAFSNWINEAIEHLPGGVPDDPFLCALHVAMIDGALIVGQVQNEIQYLPHAIIKQALLDHLGPQSHWMFRNGPKEPWQSLDFDPDGAMKAAFWHYGPSEAVLDFSVGGQRPDIIVLKNDSVTLAGEIKGRKDVSNQWESWLPQAMHHMESWSRDFPQALRGVFMTIFTGEAVEGRSDRSGLRKCHEDGHLHFAINLTHLANNQEESIRQFVAVFRRVL